MISEQLRKTPRYLHAPPTTTKSVCFGFSTTIVTWTWLTTGRSGLGGRKNFLGSCHHEVNVIYRVRVRDSYTLDSAQQGLARNRLYHPVVPAYPAIFLPSSS